MTRADQQDLAHGQPESASCVSETQTCGCRGEDIDRLHLLPPTTWPPDQTLERTFFPREMLTGMKTKQCPITLTLNRHNHTKVSAGNLSMIHAKPIGHCMRLVATYAVNISRKILEVKTKQHLFHVPKIEKAVVSEENTNEACKEAACLN